MRLSTPFRQSFAQRAIYQHFHRVLETPGAACNNVIDVSNPTNHAGTCVVQLIHSHTPQIAISTKPPVFGHLPLQYQLSRQSDTHMELGQLSLLLGYLSQHLAWHLHSPRCLRKLSSRKRTIQLTPYTVIADDSYLFPRFLSYLLHYILLLDSYRTSSHFHSSSLHICFLVLAFRRRRGRRLEGGGHLE